MSDFSVPERIETRFRLTQGDLQAFARACRARTRGNLQTDWRRWLGWVVIGVGGLYLALQAVGANDRSFGGRTIAAVVFSTLVVVVLIALWARWRRGASSEQDMTFVADASGLVVHWGAASQTRADWTDVRNIERTDGHIFIWLGDREAIIVPLRALGTEQRIDALNELMIKAGKTPVE